MDLLCACVHCRVSSTKLVQAVRLERSLPGQSYVLSGTKSQVVAQGVVKLGFVILSSGLKW